MSSAGEETLAVELPPSATPGSPLNIQTPDGRVFEIIIPLGTAPGRKVEEFIPAIYHLALDCSGQIINVIVPSSAEGGVVTEQITESSQTTQPVEHSSGSKALGVAAVAAVAGTLLIGPVVGVVCAGVAIYSTTRNDEIGDASRSVGDAACTLYDKGKEVGTKYGLFDKMKAAASATKAKLSEINDEYKITDKAKEAGSKAYHQAKEVDAKYEISSSAGKAITKGIIMGAKEVTKLSAGGSSGGESSSGTTRK